jgi:murein DD-endopeptidase MepM/ murein hydrolase activator NlpD
MQKRPFKIHHLHHLLRRHHRRTVAAAITIIGLIVLFMASIVFFPSSEYNQEPLIPITEPSFVTSGEVTIDTGTGKTEAGAEVTLPMELTSSTSATFAQPQLVTVRAGESLSRIFKRLHISQEQLMIISKLPGVQKQIRALRRGQVLEFTITNNQLQILTLPISKTSKLVIMRTATGFTETTTTEQIETSTKVVNTIINTSFYNDGTKAGINHALLANFAIIFSTVIDSLQGGLHKGDAIYIAYQQIKNLKTQQTETGNILAAAITHNGKTYYAVRYEDGNGAPQYYDQNGKNLRKAFRRKPVDIGYISSPFNLHRRHPILGIIRPHLGTDFAAPYGTPIYATGDGRIILRDRKGGYGRCIMINHGNGIVTLYGHMSRFASQFKQGSYVKLGQVIGYIGMSGLAEGFHVHYEVRINNQFKNPMTINLPTAAPISSKQKATYLSYVHNQVQLLGIPDNQHNAVPVNQPVIPMNTVTIAKSQSK